MSPIVSIIMGSTSDLPVMEKAAQLLNDLHEMCIRDSICSLIATKMNGSLTLDPGYSKGARFVLELHA